MTKAEIDRLAAQLQAMRSIGDMHGPQGEALRRDLARLAREDLYMANRLFDTHVQASLREQPGVKPITLKVATLIERHYEGRAREARPPVQIYSERDAEITQPKSGRAYEGEVVGRTPDFIVQKVDDDYVLHRHANLTLDPSILKDNVSIRYPFTGPTAMGLVRERNLTDHQALSQLAKSAHQKDIGISHEAKSTPELSR
ncbi:hypothetical protein [Castellaniella sp.]|uniref:KfrB domain-containing protein n=1 Tax=Castellaniella sp. TaxID=1955812 RepID=UPI002B001C57|nr:hypothetical protein [Castellaniella sp.]